MRSTAFISSTLNDACMSPTATANAWNSETDFLQGQMRFCRWPAWRAAFFLQGQYSVPRKKVRSEPSKKLMPSASHGETGETAACKGIACQMLRSKAPRK
eukprot:6190643-Pleurochrysis_carterae.AAC.3